MEMAGSRTLTGKYKKRLHHLVEPENTEVIDPRMVEPCQRSLESARGAPMGQLRDNLSTKINDDSYRI